MTLAEKGVDHELVPVDVFAEGGPPKWYLAFHPFGRIPAFEHDGFRLYETGAITRYVDEAFNGPALQPRDPRSRATMNQIIGLLDAYADRSMIWERRGGKTGERCSRRRADCRRPAHFRHGAACPFRSEGNGRLAAGGSAHTGRPACGPDDRLFSQSRRRAFPSIRISPAPRLVGTRRSAHEFCRYGTRLTVADVTVQRQSRITLKSGGRAGCSPARHPLCVSRDSA